jgi:integrase
MSRLDDFLSLYASRFTRRNYRGGVKKFADVVFPGGAPLSERVDAYCEGLTLESLQRDVLVFNQSLNGAPPKTARTHLAAVKMFFLESGFELPARFWRGVLGRRRGHRALTIDKIPSRKELSLILNAMPLNGRALFLLLASSGMRIGECLQLRFEDFDFEARTIMIKGAYTKSGDGRVVFYSRECAECLNRYLEQREAFLQRSIDRSRFKKGRDDRVFPMIAANAYKIWQVALDRTKLGVRDPSTNRNKFHPHVLRKRFRTVLGPVVSVDIVESLMGHGSYLTDVYRKYSVEDLAKFYAQGEPSLNAFSSQETDEAVKSLRDENERLKRDHDDLKAQMNEMNERVEKLFFVTAEAMMKGDKTGLEKLVEAMRKYKP